MENKKLEIGPQLTPEEKYSRVLFATMKNIRGVKFDYSDFPDSLLVGSEKGEEMFIIFPKTNNIYIQGKNDVKERQLRERITGSLIEAYKEKVGGDWNYFLE